MAWLWGPGQLGDLRLLGLRLGPLGVWGVDTHWGLTLRPSHGSPSLCGCPRGGARPWFPDAFLSPGRSGIEEQRHQGPAVRAGPGLQGAEGPPPPPHPGAPNLDADPQIRVLTQSEAICAHPGSLGQSVAEPLLAPPGARPAWCPVRPSLWHRGASLASGAVARGFSLFPQVNVHVLQAGAVRAPAFLDHSWRLPAQCPDLVPSVSCTERPQLPAEPTALSGLGLWGHRCSAACREQTPHKCDSDTSPGSWSPG